MDRFLFSSRWRDRIGLLALLVLSAGLYLSLVRTPADYYQGEVARIMNLHVPLVKVSLLAYLVLRRSSPQPRQHLAFALWPDTPEDQARTNLRTLMARLREALPDADQYLAVDTQTVQWRSDELARRFRREGHDWWTLVREDDFADFCAEHVPALRERGWEVDIQPGFAHHPQDPEGWHIQIHLEAGNLPPKGVAFNRDVHQFQQGLLAIGILREEDRPSARSPDGFLPSKLAQRLCKAEIGRQLADGG